MEIILLLVAPVLVTVGLMWQWPKCRRPLAWIASAAMLVCLLYGAAISLQPRTPTRTATLDSPNFALNIFSGLGEFLMLMLLGYLFLASLVIVVIGFAWSGRRPLGIGRGVVVESDDEVKRK